MSPRNIIARARSVGLDMLAICDHNSAENASAVIRAAAAACPVALPGLEICSREEVHVLAIFEHPDAALTMQSTVYDHLAGQNTPELFGDQPVVGDDDEILRFQDRLLIGATDLGLEWIVGEIHRLRGLAIASHIDREAFGVIGHLGFIPPSLRFDALELCSPMTAEAAAVRFPSTAPFVLIRNSDAHRLEEIGAGACTYLMEAPLFGELRKALTGADGRTVCEA
jgi:3',5'-nucleoside bisphosphate phosphatase